MKKLISSVKNYWYYWLVGTVLACEALLFLIFRGSSYLQVHDNLDLFVAHYSALKKHGLWFAQNADVPIIHGVSRDLFGSEFTFYNLLYIILPPLWAYFAGYALKVFLGIFSVRLLAKDVLGQKYDSCRGIILVCGCAYGLVPVFPAYGPAFTSIPILIFLLRRLYLYKEKNIKKLLPLYAAVFCYPFISYFSYHGFFILAWMCIVTVVLLIKDKRFPLKLFAAVIVLSLGYVCFEYRLFREMLFGDTLTIRNSMVHASLSFGEMLKAMWEMFFGADFHEQDSHTYLIFWITLAALIIVNVRYIRRKEKEKILKDPLNLIFIMIVVNNIIYGLYMFRPFWSTVESIMPKLTGFNYGRTTFLNPCLWYLELTVICVRLWHFNKLNSRRLSGIIAAAALLAVMLIPQMYNDFYYTVYNQAYRLIKHKDTDYLNYDEFYSAELFESIKQDIGYSGEWSAAFGLHPAVLDYNGFSTIDGYLGMYSQEYKDTWTKLTAPAMAGSPSLAQYYNDWGARVWLCSASDENSYVHSRAVSFNDHRLLIDMDVLHELDCRYIFSRVEISNASDLGISLLNSYTGHGSPYTIFVYDCR